MKKAEILTLFDYNYWANKRVTEAASRITPAQFISPAPVSFGSLRGTLAHILGTEIVWRMRCQEGVSPKSIPSEADYPVLEALVGSWQTEEKTMRAFLDTLDDADLDRSIHYTNTRGKPYDTPLWNSLLHVVNHGTQFRGEAGAALAELGHSPGDLDLILYFRQLKIVD